MSKKLGRNEPCWCGSGVKYKHCHYRRGRKKPVGVQDVVNALKKSYRKHECLHPEAPLNCKGNIIKAHTIQRNGGLSRIARDGHVYTLFSIVPSFKGFAMSKVGVNQASTFTGFCKYHDNLLFTPIEDQPIEISQRHALLLAFRAICRELFGKRRAHEFISFGKSLDRGKDLKTQLTLQQQFTFYQLGTEAALHNLEYHKSLMDAAIIRENFSDVYYYVVLLDRPPDVVCSGAIYPDYDFQGNIVQDLLQVTRTRSHADCVAFSLLATENGGVAFFSWIGKSIGNEQLMSSLDALSDEEVPDALVRFTFEYFENTYVSPDWWDGLPQYIKQKIIDRFKETISMTAVRKPKCLVDDSVRVASGKVSKRLTNVWS